MMSGRAAERMEIEWVAQTLALAALGEGRTSPNPRVGCILVRDGQIVGRGYHRALGEPHAEAVAIADAGDKARGATLYVNLEPCAHQGRTPPCVDLIVRSGVRRVVASMGDPNPLVDGRGFALLREAGIEVDVGHLAPAARRLNEPFLHWNRLRVPLVTLKAALSLDGRLAAEGGFSKWITGEPARRFAHRLRLRHDALLVGAGTVRRDDPRLTVRLGGSLSVRRRIVLSASLDMDPASAIFDSAHHSCPPTRIYTTDAASVRRREKFAGRAEIVPVGMTRKRLDLRTVLLDLAGLDVQSLLVEGGGETYSAFLEAGIADRGALFFSNKLIGNDGSTPMLAGPAVREPSLGWRLEQSDLLPLGRDFLLLGSFKPPELPVGRR
jgi:diaminohydroxyphosphoribosylaminopyrimidine deaminase/5-amino-6-(5-phosphoribosylamino)uracil reductase